MASAKELVIVSLLLLSSLYTVLSCDCGIDAFQQTRPQAINENWKYTKDVYTATVDEMYCKCFPTKGLKTNLRCVHVKKDEKDSNALVASNKNEVSCVSSTSDQRSFDMMYYQDCDYILNKAKTSSTTGVTMTQSVPTVMDNSHKVDCGITTDMEEATRGKECDLTQQPCFYKMTVKKVYKGNQKEGVVINSPGPDALTTCGDPKVQLTIGQTYMIGIGSICSIIQDWIPVNEITTQDISLIEELQKTSPYVDNEEETGNDKTGDEIDNWSKDDEYTDKEKELQDDEENNDNEDDDEEDRDEIKSEEELELKKDGWAAVSRKKWSREDEEENDKMIDSLNKDLNM